MDEMMEHKKPKGKLRQSMRMGKGRPVKRPKGKGLKQSMRGMKGMTHSGGGD